MQGGLFPAYKDLGGDKTTAVNAASTNQQSWLKLSSFKSEDALTIQQLYQEKQNSRPGEDEHTPENISEIILPEPSHGVLHTSKRQRPGIDQDSSDDSGSGTERDVPQTQSEPKKHKKEKKKKHKKHKSKDKKHSHREEGKEDKSYDDYMARHGREKHQSRKVKEEIKSKLKKHSGKIFIDDMSGMSAEEAISIDRKADRNNIAYGGIYKMNISKHHKMGNVCLGLAAGESFKLGHTKKSQDKDFHRERYFSRENRKLLNDFADIISPVLSENKASASRFKPERKTQAEEFIPITGQTQNTPSIRVPENPLGIYDNSTQLYISGGKIPDSVTSNQEDSRVPLGESQQGISIRKKTAQFNRKLAENPQDIDLWLQLIKFQDEITIAEQPYERSKLEVDSHAQGKQASMDIKLTIMEKAIEKNPDSLSLKLKQLEMCKDMWEPEKLKAAWKNLVFSQTNNPFVWKHYLEFLQTKFSSFTVGNVLKAHTKCLSTLKGIVDGTMKSHSLMPGTKEAMIDIFVSFCRIMRSAGHTEKAVSLFQAMIELNLFCPDILVNESYWDRLEFLETFWDTPVGRLGENGAQGWAQYVESKGEVPHVEPWNKQAEDEDVEEGILRTTRDRSQMWTALELSRGRRHWLSWRPDVESGQDDNDCEDAERLILFDDISPCLFELDDKDQKFTLLLLFLQFLGLHFPNLGQNPIEHVNEKAMFKSTMVKDIEILAELSDKDDEYVRLEQFVVNVLNQTIPLFDGHRRVLLTTQLLKYKYQILQEKLVNVHDKKEKKHMIKTMNKFVKNILKEDHNRNELLLWECYGIIEYKLRNVEEAKRVILTALSLHDRSQDIMIDSMENCVVLKLFSTLIDIEMESVQNLQTDFLFKHGDSVHSSNANCLLILCQACDGDMESKEVSATRTLKCRNKWQQFMAELVARHKGRRTMCTVEDLVKLRTIGSMLIYVTKLYALFQYFTVGKTAATVVHSQTVDKIKPAGCASSTVERDVEDSALDTQATYNQEVYEQCWTHYLSMLKYHMEHTVAPLSVLRIPLEHALQEMPGNVTFLQLYTQLEGKSNIAGRLRRFFHKACAQAKSPAPWLCILSAEFTRMQNRKKQQCLGLNFLSSGSSMESPLETGLSHQIRAWFERASHHQSTKHCVLLWRIYMLFEKKQGSDENSRAVFYRSVQQCPQAKCLYMDYVGHFPSQLQEVCDLLVEKEIRLRLPLEELDILTPDEGTKEDINNEDSKCSSSPLLDPNPLPVTNMT